MTAVHPDDATGTAPGWESSLAELLQQVPLAATLGLSVEDLSTGRAVIGFSPQAGHMNSLGMVHGGALMSMLDVALAMAARTLQPASAVITIEMKTMFMQAARGPLRAHGEVLHRTGRMAYASGVVLDETGRSCAHATGTFRFVTPVGRP